MVNELLRAEKLNEPTQVLQFRKQVGIRPLVLPPVRQLQLQGDWVPCQCYKVICDDLVNDIRLDLVVHGPGRSS